MRSDMQVNVNMVKDLCNSVLWCLVLIFGLNGHLDLRVNLKLNLFVIV